MGLKRGRNCAVIWASWAIWPSTTLSNSTVRRWLTWLTSIAQSWRRAAKPSRWHRGSMRNAVMPVDMQERRRDIIDYVFWRGQVYMAGQTKSNAGAVRRREFNYWRSEIAARAATQRDCGEHSVVCWVKSLLTRRLRWQRMHLPLFSKQGRIGPLVYCVYTALRRSVQDNGDAGCMDSRHCWWGGEADQLGAL